METTLNDLSKEELIKKIQLLEQDHILLKSYYAVINNAIDAIFILDKEGKFVDVNNTAVKMYGYSRDFFIGKTPEFLSSPNKNEKLDVMEKIKKAFHGENIEFIFWGRRKSGEEFPKMVRLSKVDYLGKDSITAIGLDISERYYAEQKLKESEERYRTIFNQLPVSIMQIDNSGYIIDINNSHIKDISKDKKSKDDIIGTNVLELESIKKANISTEYKNLLKGQSFYLSEVKFPNTTGNEEVYFNIQGVPLLSGSEKIGALITSEDVSKDVLNRKQLEEAKVRLNLALDGASIAIWDCDFRTETVYRSDRWFEMLGYNKNDFDDSLNVWLNLIHPDDISDSINTEFTQKNSEPKEFISEQRLRNANNEYQWILNWGRIIERDEDGSPLRAAGIHMDITDRKIAEENFNKSEEYYKALFYSQPNIIWDEDFSEVKNRFDELKREGIKDFNKYFKINPKEIEHLAGLVKINEFNLETLKVLEVDSEDELIKNLPYYFNTEDSWRVFKDELVALANNQSTFESEVTVRTLKGNTRHLFFRLVVPQESKVTFKRVLVSFTDITDLRKTDLELKETQQKYLSLVDQAKVGIIINQDWQLKFANKYLANMFGYTLDEVLNAPIDKFLEASFTEKTKKIFMDRMTGENVQYVYESVAKRKDRSTFPIEINASFMIYNGKPAVQSIVRDITKQKESEQKNKLLNIMLRDTPIGYLVTDINGIITDLNPALENISGYSRNELLGKSPEILNAEVNAKKIQDTIFKTIQNKKTWQGELLNRKKNGDLHYINSSIFPLYEKNKIIAFVGFQIDITDRVVAGIKLRESNEKLRNLYRYLNKVREEERKSIAREVHDNLGQKLTALNLDISWFKQNIPEKLSHLSKDLEPVLELINDSIITVQEISTSLRPGILDDLGLVNAIQWQSNEYSRRTDLVFELNLREINIDISDDIKTALFRVYQETLTNIVRHAKATSIKVNLELKNKQILFEIIDDGIGIPKNKLDDLSSFGLIGMRERIESINGIIEFKNRLNKGTKIKISVPLMEE